MGLLLINFPCYCCNSQHYDCYYFLYSSSTGTDHGVKAQGDGWLLTVALVEGSNVGVVDATGFSDPYVVFTCNGRTRTSSIKFQKSNPVWNGNIYVSLLT